MNADDPNRARLGWKAIDAERGGRSRCRSLLQTV